MDKLKQFTQSKFFKFSSCVFWVIYFSLIILIIDIAFFPFICNVFQCNYRSITYLAFDLFTNHNPIKAIILARIFSYSSILFLFVIVFASGLLNKFVLKERMSFVLLLGVYCEIFFISFFLIMFLF